MTRRHGAAVAIVIVALLVWGCAMQPRRVVTVARPATTPATTQPTKADLALEEITPAPTLAHAPTTNVASTQSTYRPPLEAIKLFAEARDSMLDGRRYTAIGLLE